MAASGKSTPRRLLKREARREQILAAALKAFSRGGYHGTHVADVIAEADIARGTFYLHFQSKHDVFAALVDRTLAILLDVRPAGEEPPVRRRADAEAILRASYATVLETIHEHRQLMRLLFDEALGIDKGFRKQLDQHFGVWHERIVQTLAFFQERGVARADLDVEVTGQLALGMVERLARRYLFGARKPDIPRLVDALVAFELRGIAGR
ncbi:MAG: TetR/AcrR family transcriptional regulator [Planctomycetota bacterium]|nr:TetR/AcrR family transcriptional regulator [Planctomycetota bacterium]